MSEIPAITVKENIIDHPIGEDETVVPAFIYLINSKRLDDEESYYNDIAHKLILIHDYTPNTPIFSKLAKNHPAAHFALSLYFDNGGGPCYLYALPLNKESIATAEYAQLLAPIIHHDVINVVAVLNSHFLGFEKKQALHKDKAATNHADFWEGVLRQTKQRNDIFCLIDAPQAEDAVPIFMDKLKPLATSSAAVYWPYLVSDNLAPVLVSHNLAPKKFSPLKSVNGYVLVPPSVAVAAVMYKTDRDSGIWKAPANVKITHVLKPEFDYAYKLHENRDLVANSSIEFGAGPSPESSPVNYLLSLPGMGTRVWGCRTLQTHPANGPKYIQQRRLMTYIERNMIQLASFMVFEPNTPLTWFTFKSIASQWLHELWQSGGLLGASEEEAWKLELGLRETMTVDDIENGRIIIALKVKILNPIEFIDIKLNLSINQPSSSTNPGGLQPKASTV